MLRTGSHSFETLFDHAPHVRAQACGVAVLAAEGDRQGRLVAATVPLATRVLVARRRDPVVHASSANVAGPTRMVYVLGEETHWHAWVDYVQAVTATLREGGHEALGFDLLARSELPLGRGLAASTALVVAILRALRDAYALGFDDDALARLAHLAERDFVGAPASVTTAIAVTRAAPGTAIVVDGATGASEAIALPPEVELAVVPTSAAEVDPAATLASVDDVVAALRDGDADRLQALLGAREGVLRLAGGLPDVLAARPTTGASGSAVLALVKRGRVRECSAAIAETVKRACAA